MFLPWLVVALICFGGLCYVIGRHNDSEKDAGGMMVAALIVSLLWPLVFSVLFAFGPFVWLYGYGVRKRKIELEKAKKKKLEIVK
jgi:chromate transport protein ChrA